MADYISMLAWILKMFYFCDKRFSSFVHINCDVSDAVSVNFLSVISLIRFQFELELSSSRSTRAVLKDILRSSQR